MDQKVSLTVFYDAVKADICDGSRCSTVGWFRDEVSALGAIAERLLFQSAICPEIRRLPDFAVSLEYRKMNCGHPPQRFRRGVGVRQKRREWPRRVVLLPCAHDRPWLGWRRP